MDDERVLNDREYRRKQIGKTEVLFFWVASIATPIALFTLGWKLLVGFLGVGLFCSLAAHNSLNPLITYVSMWTLYKNGFGRVRKILVKQ